MARGLANKSLKKTKRERITRRLGKLETIAKAKEDGTYIPKPWENRPLLKELYSFAIKSHTTAEQAGEKTLSLEHIPIDDSLLDLVAPGTPGSTTGSVHSLGCSSVTSQSSKYSLRNIEKQLLSRTGKVPTWLTRKERSKVFHQMRNNQKFRRSSKGKRAVKKMKEAEKINNSKMEIETATAAAAVSETQSTDLPTSTASDS